MLVSNFTVKLKTKVHLFMKAEAKNSSDLLKELEEGTKTENINYRNEKNNSES